MENNNGTILNERRKYSEKDVQDAVKAIRERRMNVREAEQAYGVPKSTLDWRSKGGLSPQAAQTTLSQTTENLIVDILGHLSDVGYGCDKKMFLYLVEHYLKQT